MTGSLLRPELDISVHFLPWAGLCRTLMCLSTDTVYEQPLLGALGWTDWLSYLVIGACPPGPRGQQGSEPRFSSRWRQRAQQRDCSWLGALKTSWKKGLPKPQLETSVGPSWVLKAQGEGGPQGRGIQTPHSHSARASLAWRAASCPLPSCLPLEGDADQLEPRSLFLRPNEGRTGGVAFWGQGGSC